MCITVCFVTTYLDSNVVFIWAPAPVLYVMLRYVTYLNVIFLDSNVVYSIHYTSGNHYIAYTIY